MSDKPAKPPVRTPQQIVKDHATELFNRAVSDFRQSMLNRDSPPVLSDTDYNKIMQGFADRSIKSANTFRNTWVRLKGAMFPSDDK